METDPTIPIIRYNIETEKERVRRASLDPNYLNHAEKSRVNFYDNYDLQLQKQNQANVSRSSSTCSSLSNSHQDLSNLQNFHNSFHALKSSAAQPQLTSCCTTVVQTCKLATSVRPNHLKPVKNPSNLNSAKSLLFSAVKSMITKPYKIMSKTTCHNCSVSATVSYNSKQNTSKSHHNTKPTTLLTSRSPTQHTSLTTYTTRKYILTHVKSIMHKFLINVIQPAIKNSVKLATSPAIAYSDIDISSINSRRRLGNLRKKTLILDLDETLIKCTQEDSSQKFNTSNRIRNFSKINLAQQKSSYWVFEKKEIWILKTSDQYQRY